MTEPSQPGEPHEGQNAGAPGDATIGRRSFPSRTKAPPEETRRFAVECAKCLRDDKCEQVLVLDVSRTSQVTDFIVLATGTSDRQMKASLDHVIEYARGEGYGVFGRSADDRATWLLADFVDVVVHLFEPAARSHYDLELMWGDAPRVEVPPGPGPLARAGGGPQG